MGNPTPSRILSIRFPIAYNFWSQLRQRKAEQRQGQLKRTSLQDQVRIEVRTAYEDLLFWGKEIPKRQEAFEKIRALYRAASNGSPAAKSIGARIAFLDSELAYLGAVQEHLVAQARLERAIGRPLE